MKMAEGDFPVVFFDGEREIDMGNIRIKSTLNFKTFQLGLSQRIGISPNQITVYLVHLSPPRKIPITNKSNFLLLVRETGCYFLVVLKRTRRHRRPALALDPEPEKTILKRGEIEFAERMRELQIMREKYVAEMSLLSDSRVLAGLGVFPTIRESFSAVNCGECEVARRQGKTAAYHHCVRDAVVVGFRSTAGPIAPPCKQRGKE